MIYNLEFTNEQLQSIYDYLPQQQCRSNADIGGEEQDNPNSSDASVSVYYNGIHKKEDWNRYDTPLRIPRIHKEWVQSRLMYEIVSGSLPWVEHFVQTKQVVPVRNPYHFRTLEHEHVLYAKRM